MYKLSSLVVALVIVSACKSGDKTAPSSSSAAGSAATAKPASGSGDTVGSAGSGETAASEVATGSAGSAGSGDTTAAVAAGSAASGDACEAYYAAEVKFVTEEKHTPTGKHDEFMAMCRKLPAELQQCQTDVQYALDHDAACGKLLKANMKQVQTMRRLIAGM